MAHSSSGLLLFLFFHAILLLLALQSAPSLARDDHISCGHTTSEKGSKVHYCSQSLQSDATKYHECTLAGIEKTDRFWITDTTLSPFPTPTKKIDKKLVLDPVVVYYGLEGRPIPSGHHHWVITDADRTGTFGLVDRAPTATAIARGEL